MASAAAKPYQEDSLEVYLITVIFSNTIKGEQVVATLFNESEQRHLRLFITNVYLQESRWGKLIQKLLLNQKCMGYLVRAYYSISPTRYYKDDSWWSADLKSNEKQILENFDLTKIEPSSKSKAIEDIISIGSFVEALVLNHYVLVRKI
ncbi:hypothetical protein Tco_0490065, partial [Tanacetum coccineum]